MCMQYTSVYSCILQYILVYVCTSLYITDSIIVSCNQFPIYCFFKDFVSANVHYEKLRCVGREIPSDEIYERSPRTCNHTHMYVHLCAFLSQLPLAHYQNCNCFPYYRFSKTLNSFLSESSNTSMTKHIIT